ncbi:ribonuclease III domain-containing protein [Zychaea mexicana]|uniref:ribonuclease III domain-containing protein n=1 Tax=Zychaea mexicana TaxID=64656 RepID=UPI0022FDBE7A|nr:ribonuclease III domain-containing protein [Zychaea mexicana]KAI9491042.1 ribonuclease III domain-containing protein [Zychaea mexicana]
MIGALSRARCQTAPLRCVRATRVMAFHAKAPVMNEQQELPPNVATPTSNNSTLSAFGARVGLQSLSPSLLEQAVTHSSATNLTYLGKRVLGLYATEYLHSKYPSMHMSAFNEVLKKYIGYRSLSHIGREVGLQDVVRREHDEEVQSTVLAECFNALVGALYQEQGPEAAKKFVHAHILSRELDVRPLIKLENPKRYLSALMKKTGQEAPVSRLLSETGRLSSAPVFVIGVFSGENKLGEGFGSSLKMAEYRACQDALASHYGKEEKDFVLPSDADKVDNYKPAALGCTEAIV